MGSSTLNFGSAGGWQGNFFNSSLYSGGNAIKEADWKLMRRNWKIAERLYPDLNDATMLTPDNGNLHLP